MKIRSILFAGLICTLGLTSLSTVAAELMTAASINENMASLSGQTISTQGKVVKVNNGIMKRNFVHVQDGKGDANKVIVTSKQTAKVGDQVTVTGVVKLNRDFGGGYSYPLLIEDSSIEINK